jgi:hypothetical protein
VTARALPRWPLLVIALPAAVSVWAGWVGLGQACGFGVVHPLPGTPLAHWRVDTAITLPIGIEAYGAYALRVWLGERADARTVRFARASAVGALVLGMAGQVAYHLLQSGGHARAPLPLVALVGVLPVGVLGLAAALWHLVSSADALPVPAPAAPEQRADERAPRQPGERAAPPERAPEPDGERAPVRLLAPVARRARARPVDASGLEDARAEWERAERGPAPMTGARLAAALGCSEGHARKVAQGWRAERAREVESASG